ncbi:uncharacterized protein LOC105186241 [Harpegnathos saltator]|uniref:uncharacterized protein LOC105186241 n=1 Tax=Harpegnathos saltator TaxID=610380 RepID=UPI0005913FEA|nr:uncharacterized protein LOC105186241 [Harpegnathos saltator]
MSLKMNENDGYMIKFTANKTEKSIRVQQQTRDLLRNANVSQYASENTRDRQAVLYLKENRIYDFIEFLIGNLLLHRPYDPYEYLSQLLDTYILSRDGLVDSSFSFPFYKKGANDK